MNGRGTILIESSPYRLFDDQWAAATGDKQLTWSFADLNHPTERQEWLGGTFDSIATRNTVRDAFDAWEQVCGVDFVEVADSEGSNIRIGWASEDRSDGEGGFGGLSPTWFSGTETLRNAIVLDRADFDPDDDLFHEHIYDIVLHEVGHALGLDHSDVANVVMSGGLYNGEGTTPYWEGVPGRNPLQLDDVAGAIRIWGAREGSGLRLGTDGDDTITGGAGADTILGHAGDDALLGGTGDDSISGGEGNDSLWGQDGNDGLDGGAGSDLVYGLDGSDSLAGGDARDIILGGEGNDRVLGGGGDDGIWAEGGNDTVDGGAGADFLAGGRGDDVLTGGGGGDYLAGEAGNDTLDGGAGYDVLSGGGGNDRLIGGADGSTFFGQAGADTFVVSGGANWIMDLAGEDRIEGLGMTLSQVQAAATQQGAHLHVAFDGGDLYLAFRTIADVDTDALVG